MTARDLRVCPGSGGRDAMQIGDGLAVGEYAANRFCRDVEVDPWTPEGQGCRCLAHDGHPATIVIEEKVPRVAMLLRTRLSGCMLRESLPQ